jgi:hypothetical protein
MKQDEVTNNEVWNTLKGCIKFEWKTGERGVTNGTPLHCVLFYAITKHVLWTDRKSNSEQREEAGFAVP